MTDQTEQFDTQNTKHEPCLNCGHAFAEGDKYCAKCSQKRHLHLSVADLMHEFSHMLTHLDSKFFMMLKHLFIPGRISSDFIAGKRKTYPHPVRFFIVTSALFLLVFFKLVAPDFASGVGNSIANTNSSIGKIYKPVMGPTISYAARSQEFLFDTLGNSKYSLPQHFADSFFREVFGINRDSILLKTFKTGEGGGPRISFSSNDIPIKDLFVMHPDTLMVRYSEEIDQRNRIKKFASKQFLKASQEPGDFLKKYVANFAFTFLVMILLQALVLKLLYARRKRLYVEHVLVLMNMGTALLISLIVLCVWGKIPVINEIMDWVSGLWLLWFMYFNYKTLRVVYKQSRGRTMAKFVLYSLAYLFIGLTVLLLSLVATALLFG
jgi:Protein of unknown function (DUF3667)